MMTRRQALQTTALATAAVATVPGVLAQPAPAAASGPFTLPALPYAFDALEPHIDARTMEIHHDKHHAAYVTNLNKAIADAPELAKKSVEDLLKDLNSMPEKVRTAVRNHGGGHYNHSHFWQMMKKDGGGGPKGELAKAIDNRFGSFTEFKTMFTDSAIKVFGSGWAWLVLVGSEMAIQSTPNQDSPLTGAVPSKEQQEAFQKRYAVAAGVTVKQPLLGLDVWEHAYYLKYQNKRADYIAAWWNVVNWDFVAERFAKLRG